jgi:sugar/nucleoside kinase (ribokinase family)
MTVVCLGILVADVFLPTLARLPQAGELVATEDFLVQTGGCAANTAVDLAHLGAKASVVGRVGDDVFGTFVHSDLERRGVDVAGTGKASGLGTSKTVIVTVSGRTAGTSIPSVPTQPCVPKTWTR